MIIAVDIEQNAVKIAEIDADDYVPKIVKNATLNIETADESGTIKNVSNLVKKICRTIENSGIESRNVRLCSPFLGGEVKLTVEEKKRKSLGEQLQSKPKNVQRKSVGTLKNGDKTVEYFVEATADEFLLTELANQFAECGFCLKSIEYPLAALLNLALLAPHTYDSRDKLIVNLDEKAAVVTERDVPVEIRHWNLNSGSLEQQIAEFAARDAAVLRLKNPTIIVSGSVLNKEKSALVKQSLERAGFTIAGIGASADFAACLGLAFKPKVNLLPRNTRLIFSPDFKSKAVKCAQVVAAIGLSVGMTLCLFSGTKIIFANEAVSEIPALQGQLNAAETKISELNDNFETLEKLQSKLTEFVSFVKEYGENGVFIASADTENFLPQPEVDSELDGLGIATESNPRKLIVRGYAVSGKAALDFYDALQTAHFASKMNGLQTEELSSGETVTIFELEVLL